MGLSNLLFGSSPAGIAGQVTASGIGAIMQGVGGLARDIRTAITGKLDPEKQAEFDQKLAEMENAALQGQLEINKIEAANPSIFVAGARPFIMWVCGFAMAYQYIGYSLLQWVAAIFHFTAPPLLSTEDLTTVLLALLGLGTMRTYEKSQGVENRHG